MKKISLILSSFLCAFFVVIAFAQNDNYPKIPEGMEAIPIGGGGSQLVVPKGAKTRRIGGQIIVEGSKEYMSRRFYEMEDRFTQIEQKQVDLATEVGALKDIVKGIQDKLLTIEQKLESQVSEKTEL